MIGINKSLLTRSRLIEAAGRLFAAKSYSNVTVREISLKANTHLSALNYHFNSKEKLFEEVVLHALKKMKIPKYDRQYLLDLRPEESLLILVKEGLRYCSDQSENNWYFRILNKEYWEQSGMFNQLVKSYFKPSHDLICQILSKHSGLHKEDKIIQYRAVALQGLLDSTSSYNHILDAVAPGLREFGKQRNWFAKEIVRITLIDFAESY